MGAAGQITARMNDAASPARKRFASALGDLCAFIPGTQKSIAKRLYCAESTLSSYVSARTLPKRSFAEGLYGLAEGAVQDDPGLKPIPLTWEKLERLHGLAAVRLCLGCPAAKTGTLVGDREEAAPQEVEPPKPATTPVRNAQRLYRRKKRAVLAARSRRELPVPLRQGDRQRELDRPQTAAAFAGLVERLRSGRPGEARALLHHAGGVAPVREVRDAVAACRMAGFGDAADAVLHHAGHRAPVEVLGVAKSLLDAGQHADAKVLLDAALATAGAGQ